MYKLIRDILIAIGVTVMVISTSRFCMQNICAVRDNSKWWGLNQLDRGDLACMSYLDFKYIRPKETPIPRPGYRGTKKTELYLDGDSFTRDFPDTFFSGLCGFHYQRRYLGDLKYQLDNTHKNIIVLEVAEHNVREYFKDLKVFNEIYNATKNNKTALNPNEQPKKIISEAHNKIASVFPDFHFEDLFNKNINQNLECNLFNYNFIIPMFQTKAKLNYYLFNRASGNVVISKDKQFLFFKEDVMPTGLGSSYYPIQPCEIDNLVNNLNTIYQHYRADGFTEVYLSMIPNAATIMQPENYSNLIPLIQNNPLLKMKIIDVYTVYKNSPIIYYHAADLHWNKNGKMVWLKIINKILEDMNNGITN